MKNIKHHAILISTQDKKRLIDLRITVKELFAKGMQAKTGFKLAGEITESLINEFYTMVIFPDGSKEGYETSAEGDNIRAKIIQAVEDINKKAGSKLMSFVEVAYGDETEKASIQNSN